jgi:hypothetical protein
MDDLLKVFLGETAECLAACWIAVDELRENPGDSAALVELLRQIRTVQETSRFLGMATLNAAASLTLESLESATARRPASIDRIVPIAVDGLQRIEEIIRAIADGEAGTIRHSIRTESAATLRSGSSAQFDGDHARPHSRPKKQTASKAPPRDDVPAPAPTADGTVRVDAETLSYLLTTVRDLADAQAEMMRRLNAKETPPPASPPPPAEAPAAAPAVSAVEPTPKQATTPAAEVPDRSAEGHGEPQPGPVRVLLFRDAKGVLKATRIDQVARLEEVDLKAVDRNRGLWVMRSGDELMPLVPFDPGYRLPPSGRAPVIVFTIGRDSFGLLIEAVPEAADAAPADGDRVLLDDQAIEVIDPLRYLEQTIRARFERRRSNRKRPPSAGEHRISLPERDDLFVRKPGR